MTLAHGGTSGRLAGPLRGCSRLRSKAGCTARLTAAGAGIQSVVRTQAPAFSSGSGDDRSIVSLKSWAGQRPDETDAYRSLSFGTGCALSDWWPHRGRHPLPAGEPTWGKGTCGGKTEGQPPALLPAMAGLCFKTVASAGGCGKDTAVHRERPPCPGTGDKSSSCASQPFPCQLRAPNRLTASAPPFP